MSLSNRCAGVLLHPTSLPGRYGIGDLGPEAIRFLDWIKEAGISQWQVLPLGPTGYGDSPYQCFSAFAGNPYLISPDVLVADGLLGKGDVKPPAFPEKSVDYGWVIHWKTQVLRLAYERFKTHGSAAMRAALAKFRKGPIADKWLEDYALFIALKEAHQGKVWNTWAAPLRSYEKKAIAAARKEHAAEIDYQVFIQFVFFGQWERVRAAAHERGIEIIGDMPIYVAYDSADTWANQDLFKLKAIGEPTCVAGVPPDYFSATGQLWGNPIYRWNKMQQTGYKWWIDRMRTMLKLVDIIRLDHFRGFEAYWEVPAGEKTAINGKWVKGSGAPLFAALKKSLGGLPIIAENLGVITAPVEELREQFGMPGMKVLQFGWGPASTKPLLPDPDNGFTPHKIEKTSVVYTGTHDNPTSVQWWNEFASDSEKTFFKAYLGTDGVDPAGSLIRSALSSVANTVLIPMQDFLRVGAEGRMNFPGKESGNWGWRMEKGAATKQLAKQIQCELLLFDRAAGQLDIAKQLVARQSKAERARKPSGGVSTD